MNVSRRSLIAVIAAAMVPLTVDAQDAPAEVTLVSGDDDALWVAGGKGAIAGEFTVYVNNTVSAHNVAEDYRAILDEKSPLRAFEALLDLVGE